MIVKSGKGGVPMRRGISMLFAVVGLSWLIGATAATALTADFPICKGSHRVTCIVDGDTLWFQQVKYRLEGIDTPEMAPRHKCMQEGLQARLARDRLQEIMSSNDFTITTHGKDRYGRTLGRFHIGDSTAGQMLVNEGLARPWRGRRESWCE